MGDVALINPAIEKIVENYPEIKLTIVTRNKFSIFFEGYNNVKIFEADFENKYKGFFGLLSLFFKLLNEYKPDKIIDLHQNLRTGILKLFFFFSGIKSFTINKGRKEKKALTRFKNKILIPLPHTVNRYLKTFEKAGFSIINSSQKQSFFKLDDNPKQLNEFFKENDLNISKNEFWIGLAPFAQHQQKMWDYENYIPLLEKIYAFDCKIKIFLFGGGKLEIEKLEYLHTLFPQTIVAAGNIELATELNLIKKLDLMICMDSGNMHLAALSGVKVLSIWGATHFYAGFGPYKQERENILEIDTNDLTCRPCSVFGNKPCFRGDLACLKRINPQMVFERFVFLLEKNKTI